MNRATMIEGQELTSLYNKSQIAFLKRTELNYFYQTITDGKIWCVSAFKLGGLTKSRMY